MLGGALEGLPPVAWKAIWGFLAVALFTPLVIWSARRLKWIDWPTDDRWHSKPVALMGGIAVFAAVASTVAFTGLLGVYDWPVWTAFGLIFVTGLIDDAFDIRPEAKLVAQILGTVLILYAGYAFWVGAPFWIHIPLTFLWMIGVTNAVNLIDGMDGLAAGLTTIATAVLGAVAWLTGLPGVASVAWVVMGATLGFLLFNFKPARIFMGDCGSLFLGFVLATIALTVQGQGEPLVATLVPVAVLAVPIFDTTFVTVTRILNNRPITEAGTDHTMHRLVLLGLSERQTVLLLWSIGAAFGLGALALHWATPPLFIALTLFATLACIILGLYLAGASGYPKIDIPLQVKRKTASQHVGAFMQAVAGGPYWKSIAGTIADLLVVGAAFVLAFHLRFDGAPPAPYADLMLQALPAVMAAKVVVFYLFGLYHGIWRHAGTSEFVRLLGASTTASIVVVGGLLLFAPADYISPAVVVLDWMIATAAIAAMRFGFRGLRQYFAAQRSDGHRVLIYGSDSPAVLVLRHLRETPNLERTVVGFMDPKDSRVGLHVQGVSVVGTPASLPALCEEHDIDELIVPKLATTAAQQRGLVQRCVHVGIDCRFFSLDLHPAAPVQLEAPSADYGTSDGGYGDSVGGTSNNVAPESSSDSPKRE